jgi:hypothetical protein
LTILLEVRDQIVIFLISISKRCSPLFIIDIYSRKMLFNTSLRKDAANKKNKSCAACYREVVAKGKKYCIYHTQAFANLQNQYGAWVHAYGGISETDYMNKLLTLSQTGSWVKDVINEELKTEHKKVGN